MEPISGSDLGILNEYKKRVSDSISVLFQNTVAYGPFRGMKMTNDFHWGNGADQGTMLLGLYEQEILNELETFKTQGKYKSFIDLGAADGYYGIGVLVGNIFRRSYCYEIVENGRNVIQQNAVLNGLKDQVVIRGGATNEFYKEFTPEELHETVLLVDIEGGEFDVLDEAVFHAFRKSVIIIEIHDWL